MKKVTINTDCPICHNDLTIHADVKPTAIAPNVRGKINPIGSIFVYKISSEELKHFIIRKAKEYVPEIKCEVVPRFCEKKKKKEKEQHHSYASLRVAFSENCIEESSTGNSWFAKFGNAEGIKIMDSLMKGLINKYKYDKRVISKWLEDYKVMEELEQGFGMTEAFLNDIKMYATPRLAESTAKENWVIFAAAPEKVIEDFLTDADDNKLPGRIEIKDVVSINKDIVEFLVYMYPGDIKTDENIHVRQILHGEEKAK